MDFFSDKEVYQLSVIEKDSIFLRVWLKRGYVFFLGGGGKIFESPFFPPLLSSVANCNFSLLLKNNLV